MIIAIDGPAASGKGTLGRRLARHYGFHHLDTGLLYRGVAATLMEAGFTVDNELAATAAANDLVLESLDPSELAGHLIGGAASKVAAMPAVRAALLDRQRAFARRAPGAVLDGRDIGTVVCPDADVKIYLTATPEVRARRRAGDAAQSGGVDLATILADILERDARDMNRPVAPLRQAADAVLLDTSGMDIEAAFRAAVDIVDQAIRKTG
jgi:cytidylate kinase